MRNAAILVERIARAGWFNWVPSRHLLAGMAIMVFVLEFDGPSLAQGIDLSTPEKTDEYYVRHNGPRRSLLRKKSLKQPEQHRNYHTDTCKGQ